MKRSKLLEKTLVLFGQQSESLIQETQGLEQLELTMRRVDFEQLRSSHALLRNVVDDHDLDLLLFARNDQVFDRRGIGDTIRALRMGYSSFSGIDDAVYPEQTRQCLADLVAGHSYLNLPPGSKLYSAWQPGDLGFSLVFDMEQMGGVRFGLPRILDLLEAYQTPATFFVTGFVTLIYPDLLPTLVDRGHSIGIHGWYHEYPSDDLARQIRQFATQKDDFEQHTEVKGANFILRMNESTVEALVASGFDYFVVAMHYFYFPFAYQRMPVLPFRVWTPKGSIWMVPLPFETYNHPWSTSRFAIDAAIHQARLEQAPFISVLTHPFEIGSLHHIGILEKLLKHVKEGQALQPTTIDNVIQHLPRPKPSVYIYVVLGDGELSGSGGVPKNGLSHWLWHSPCRYWQRVGKLYTSLQRLGYTPSLCLSCPQDTLVFSVYPHIPEVSVATTSVELDPIVQPNLERNLSSLLAHHTAGEKELVIFKPQGFVDNIKVAYTALHPRHVADCFGLFPEVGVRLIYRLTGYRQVF